MHDSNTQRFNLSCQTPVGWLRAISDGSHLIHLDWNQIGWSDPDRPNHVSRETITKLMAYFAGQRNNFTIPLCPANISYAAFAAAAGSPKAARAAGTACTTNPIPKEFNCT